MHPQKNKFI